VNTRIPGNTRRSGFSGARRLTPEEVADLRRCNSPRERDLERRAGIEEMRQRLQDMEVGLTMSQKALYYIRKLKAHATA
jgi:hypothetical protein